MSAEGQTRIDFKSLALGAALVALVVLSPGFNKQSTPQVQTWTDKATGVEYLIYSDGRGGLGMSPRYLHDGSFVLSGSPSFGRSPF